MYAQLVLAVLAGITVTVLTWALLQVLLKKRPQTTSDPAAFDCKIHRIALTFSENMLYGFEPGVFRNARAQLDQGRIQFVCQTDQGPKTVDGAPIGDIHNVAYDPLGISRHLELALLRSFRCGLVWALVVIIAVGFKSWNDIVYMTYQGIEVLYFFLLTYFAVAQVIAFITSFLPAAFIAMSPLLEFTVHLTNSRSFLFAVAPKEEATVLDFFQRAGIEPLRGHAVERESGVHSAPGISPSFSVTAEASSSAAARGALAFEMAIDYVFTASGKGTVVAGYVQRGAVKVGDELLLWKRNGQTVATACKGIEALNRSRDRAAAGERVSIVLDIAPRAANRGDSLVLRTSAVMPGGQTTPNSGEIQLNSTRDTSGDLPLPMTSSNDSSDKQDQEGDPSAPKLTGWLEAAGAGAFGGAIAGLVASSDAKLGFGAFIVWLFMCDLGINGSSRRVLASTVFVIVAAGVVALLSR
jgi:hypothetical protein